MKKIIIIFLALTTILISNNTIGQVSDSIYYNRLFYVCKAWGHLKYFHTEIAKGDIDWDDELLNAINGFRNAPNNDSFNDSLLLMLNNAGEMGFSSDSLPIVPDSLNNNDYSWISNSIFSNPVKAKLDTIRTRFRPQSNVYVEDSQNGQYFDSDNKYYTSINYPPENQRILALFRYWNIIHYFFTYKNIMDHDWDSILVEFIPKIIETKDALSYNLVLRRLTTKINDSHAFFYSPTYNTWVGRSYPPFKVQFIDNEMVITKVLPEIIDVNVGDIITEIDSINVDQLRDSLRIYTHGSNEVFIDHYLNDVILKGSSGSFPITTLNNENYSTSVLTRNKDNYNQLNIDASPIWRDTLVRNNSIGIVDMDRLEVDDVYNMFNDLWETDILIFDIRNYPNGTLWEIVNYLYPSSIHTANFTFPDISYPGRLYWQEEHIGSGTPEPYSGKIIILFDERTISQSEYTCMGLEIFPNAIKIGSTTAAADGTNAWIYLPGRIRTSATFLGVYYPDYTPTQRVGIIPDYEVRPTIDGIRGGKDEVLEFALNFSFNNISESESFDNLKIYPNPTKDYFWIEYNGYQSILIEIYNLYGEKMIEKTIGFSVTKIDISDLESGSYILKIHYNDKTKSKLIIKSN